MNQALPRPGPLALLAAEDFMRSLARSLLADQHEVDDVVQQTWLRTLERPPRVAAALRGWLGTVAQNLARNVRRDRARRAQREQAAARAEAVPSSLEILAREALRKQVVDAVLALEEHYRQVVVLRFYEGLAPRAIAARLGLPAGTVRARLSRALAQLRSRLDTEHGSRRAWCVPLLPLARGARWMSAAGSWIGGMLLMKGIASVAVALVGIALLWRWSSSANEPSWLREVASDARDTGARGSSDAADAPFERTAIAAATSAPSPSTGVRELVGQIVHADGSPAAGCEYRVELGRRLPVRVRHGQIGPQGGLFDPDMPFSFRTDAEGGFRFSTTRTGEAVLVVRISPELILANALPAARATHLCRLPELAHFTVRWEGLDPGDEWRVLAYPAWLETRSDPDPGDEKDWWNGGPTLEPMANTEPPAWLASLCPERGGKGAQSSSFVAVRGRPYHVALEGTGFEPSVEQHLGAAPAELVAHAQARCPVVRLRVLEADRKTLTTRHGTVVIGRTESSSNTPQLRQGELRVDFRPTESAMQPLKVLMEDGEMFTREIAAHELLAGDPQTVHSIDFVRGEGSAPLLVMIPQLQLDRLRIRALFVEHEDGTLEAVNRRERASLYAGGSTCWYAEVAPHDLRLNGLPASARKLHLVISSGAVAFATLAPGELSGALVLAELLPSSPAIDLSLRELWLRRCMPNGQARFVFLVELRSTSGVTQEVAFDELTCDGEPEHWPVPDQRVVSGLRSYLRVWPGSGRFFDVSLAR